MNSFDIIGPVMVGPSSSHTAGAVKIGNISRRLLGEPVRRAEITFHGSFLATGKGHGTDKALVAGLLGFAVDDSRIADSFRYADEAGMLYHLTGGDLGDIHPNSVKLYLTGVGGHTIQIIGASVGGGSIQITEIDGLPAHFSGSYPTLVVNHEDKPGQVYEVTAMLGRLNVNIAAMQMYRSSKGGNAVTILECDQGIPEDAIKQLSNHGGITKITYLGLTD